MYYIINEHQHNRWGTFERLTDALDFIQYLYDSIQIENINEFYVVTLTDKESVVSYAERYGIRKRTFEERLHQVKLWRIN